MKIQITDNIASQTSTDVLFVGLAANSSFTGTLATIDEITSGFFTQLKKQKLFTTKAKSINTFYDIPNIKAKTIAVITYEPNKKGLEKIAKNIVAYLNENNIKHATTTLLENEFEGLNIKLKTKALVQNLLSANYTCDTYKSKKDKKNKTTIELIRGKHCKKSISTGLDQGIAIATGMNTLKDLGNAPGNICTPKYLASQAKKLAQKHNSLTVEILKEKEIKQLKMGGLLAISKGSVQKPRLIKLQYKGGKGDPIIFVGKGITFDTGGISLKPSAKMEEMKYDMCGAGTVIGTIEAIAMLNLPINVIGIIPAAENMPSGHATKPGDIVTSMSGKTIEIINTDAEGRMILCDAITYAQQFKPKALIDIATLTGAVVIALGHHASGLMSNNDNLAEQLLAAGKSSGDRAWRMPIWEDYTKQLQSPFADLQNIGGREAGSITAGCFLGEFIKDVPWAHLDIAGTAWKTRKEGATGRPIPLLIDFLLSQIKQ